MSDAPLVIGSDAVARKERTAFLNREAAEVYLLLDFLSGHADRSLRPTQAEQAHSLLDQRNNPGGSTTDSDEVRAEIEKDLSDPTRLVQRTMRIGYPLNDEDKNFGSHATFLMRARDVLNSRAAPVTGATIAFTSLVFLHSRTNSATVTHLSEFANRAYPAFSASAMRLNHFIQGTSRCLLVVLVFALTVSGYVAWGKVMLDTLDAVRHDTGAIEQQITTARLAAKPPAPPGDICDAANPPDACISRKGAVVRHDLVSNLLKNWERPVSWACHVKPYDGLDRQGTTDLCALAGMTVLGNYLMPILYGLLGSMALILRRHGDRLNAQMLSPRDRPANHIRLLLGVVIGGCIGLVYSGSSVSQTTGILGASTTLSAAALAFLAGYGVEAVFKMLDALITQVFRVNSTDKPPLRAG